MRKIIFCLVSVYVLHARADVYSKNCVDWVEGGKTAAEQRQLPFGKAGGALYYIDYATQSLVGGGAQELIIGRKTSQFFVMTLGSSINFKKLTDRAEQKKDCFGLTDFMAVLEGSWRLGKGGTEVSIVLPKAEVTKYTSLLCGSNRCMMLGAKGDFRLINTKEDLKGAKQFFPIDGLSESIKTTCQFLKGKEICGAVNKFSSTCKVQPPPWYSTAGSIEKICETAMITAKSLLQ